MRAILMIALSLAASAIGSTALGQQADAADRPFAEELAMRRQLIEREGEMQRRAEQRRKEEVLQELVNKLGWQHPAVVRAFEQIPQRFPTLNDALAAKVSGQGDARQVVFMAEAYREEKQEVPVQRVQQELRTRLVPNAEGELVEQEFIVNVRKTENVEQTVKVPAGRKPIAVPLGECRFFEVDGHELDQAAAAERLAELQMVLLLDDTAREPPPLTDEMRGVLRPDCLIVATKQVVRENFFTVPGAAIMPRINIREEGVIKVAPVQAAPVIAPVAPGVAPPPAGALPPNAVPIQDDRL